MALARFSWTGKRAGCGGDRQRRGDAGFSLIEVLLATTLLTVAVGALSQLFVISTRANTNARVTTFTTVLAQQKMEQLRSLTWGFDSMGLPLTDTSTNITADRKSTRLNSSHSQISYAVFCLKKKKK